MLITRQAAQEEQREIQKKSRISKMSKRDIVRSIHITNYLSILDNLSILLAQCPESIDREKNLSYWSEMVRGYLNSILSGNPAMKNVQQEDVKIQNMHFSTVDTLKTELKAFLESSIIPELSKSWENK